MTIVLTHTLTAMAIQQHALATGSPIDHIPIATEIQPQLAATVTARLPTLTAMATPLPTLTLE